MNFPMVSPRLAISAALGMVTAILPLTVRLAPGQSQKAPPKPSAYFTDVAKQAGFTMTNTFGGVATKKYIIETTGTGVAIFDYDNDGWPDVFIVNGTKLESFPVKEAPTNHLYHNNHDGTF